MHQTIIGSGGVFKFQSKEYECDFATTNEGRSASSDTAPIKLPAYSIIKSISVIVTQLTNSGDYKVRIDLADDSGSVGDAGSYTNATEILGAGATDTCSGNSASAVDIDLGSGAVLKQSYYNGYAGAGLPVGTADKYIRIANGDHGTNSNPTAGKIKVLVEYVGLD